MKFLLANGGNRPLLLPRLPRPPAASAKQVRAMSTVALQRTAQSSLRNCLHSLYSGGGEELERVVVVMGATGTGKSKLSIELSAEFDGEVVNSDKIQVYRGLDITTNKMPAAERLGVPHHLLGELDPSAGELPPAGFRALAACSIAGISSRRRVPVLAGGSNSFIHALLSDRFDPRLDPFGLPAAPWRPWLRYRCCFLWVHVEAAVLAEQLDRRVDEMVAEGMVEELERYFAAEGAGAAERHPGLGKAIGVPEFQAYFMARGARTAASYKSALAAIKANTRRLAKDQVRKIERLAAMGWPLRRVDATAAVAAKLAGEKSVAALWRRDVAAPGVAAVARFLEEEGTDAVGRRDRVALPSMKVA